MNVRVLAFFSGVTAISGLGILVLALEIYLDGQDWTFITENGKIGGWFFPLLFGVGGICIAWALWSISEYLDDTFGRSH